MKKILAFSIALLSLFAVVLQYKLMMANRVNTVLESTMRFFSYFTVLTNILVGTYFSYLSHQKLCHKDNFKINLDTLTAITVYISIVGLVYQLLLRQTWDPTGIQKIADELLHSVNPFLVILFWFLNRKTDLLNYRKIGAWLIYPLIYLLYMLTRGYFSGFYPYPFVDISHLGLSQVLANSLEITLLFVIVSTVFIWLNRYSLKIK